MKKKTRILSARIGASALALVAGCSSNGGDREQVASAQSSVTASVPATTIVPQIAAEFVNSIGLNVHLSYVGTVYTNQFSKLETLAQELGVKHYRDGIVTGGTETEACDNTKSMAQATGGTMDFIVGQGQVLSEIQSYVGCVGARYVDALEGPNELDLHTGSYVDEDINEMKVIAQAVETVAGLKHVTVVAPSLAKEAEDYVTLATVLGASRPFTVGNGHFYFANHNPGSTGWGANHTVDGKTYNYGTLGFNFGFSEALSGTEPLYITETGFESAGAHAIGTTYQANYLPRGLMLEHAQAPAGSREYVYELADEGASDGSYALLDSSANIKPAYTALERLMTALSDPAGGTGSGVSKAPVHFAVTGTTSNVQTMVYRKSTGEIDVAVWIETDEIKEDGAPKPQAVSINVEGSVRDVSATDTVQYVVFKR